MVLTWNFTFSSVDAYEYIIFCISSYKLHQRQISSPGSFESTPGPQIVDILFKIVIYVYRNYLTEKVFSVNDTFVTFSGQQLK